MESTLNLKYLSGLALKCQVCSGNLNSCDGEDDNGELQECPYWATSCWYSYTGKCRRQKCKSKIIFKLFVLDLDGERETTYRGCNTAAPYCYHQEQDDQTMTYHFCYCNSQACNSGQDCPCNV